MSSSNVQHSDNHTQNTNNGHNSASGASQTQVEHSIENSDEILEENGEKKKLRYTHKTLRIPPPLLHNDGSNSTIEITESFAEPENMIDLTVKTLDSQNHPFHVEDDITIRQFKEKISDCLNIPPDSQRLIFCGRVLQDDKKLSEYALVSGNTVHMVQRPPPQSVSGAQTRTGPTRDSGTATNGTGANGRHGNNGMRRSHTFRMMPSNVDRNAMYLGAMAYPADLMEAQGIQLPQPSSSLCASRLNIARRMLRRAGDVLSYLENPRARPPPRNTTSPTTVQVSQQIEVIEVGIGQIEDADNHQVDGPTAMNENSNIAEAATAAAISAAVTAAQEVGVPNITIYRGSSNTSDNDETVIHIEATEHSDNSDQHHDESMTDESINENATNDGNNTGPGHSRSSSTDSFSSATEFPVTGASNTEASANQNTSPSNEGASERNAASERPTNESVTQPNTPLAPLGVLLDELNAVQTRLQPFMAQYHYILLQDPTYVDHADAVAAQRVYNRVSQIMHLLSHAYHAISDLMVDLHTSAPRYLRCRPILIQHSAVVQTGIPIQAEFNISNMMSEAANANNNRQASSTGTAEPPQSGTADVSREEDNTIPNSEVPPTSTSDQPMTTQASRPPPVFAFQNPSQQGANTQRQNFGFSLPDGIVMGGNVEVVMEVTPRYTRTFNLDNTSNAPQANSDNGTGTGVTIPLPQPPSGEMLANIMQAVAGQIMTRMHGGLNGLNTSQQGQRRTTTTGQGTAPNATESTSSNTAANVNQPGQNSQARVNTATHPTTSTQTRSTARPHVQLRPAALRLPLGGHLGGVTSAFDPFLPCNSHHLRARRRHNTSNNVAPASATASANNNNNNESDNNEVTMTDDQSQQQPSSSGQGATATPSEQLSAPSGLLRDVFATRVVSETLQNAFIDVLDSAHESGNLMLDIIVHLARRIPLNDVFLMLMGDPAPLVRLRPTIRQLLITRLLQNEAPTQAAYAQATERIIDQLREHFQIIEDVPTLDNIDLIRTIESVIRGQIPNILALAINESTPEDQNQYGSQLMSSIRNFVHLVVGTIMRCCGTSGAEDIFRRYVDEVARGSAEANVLMFTMSYSINEFRNYMSALNVDPNTIQPFIVYRTQSDQTGASEPMELRECIPVINIRHCQTIPSSSPSQAPRVGSSSNNAQFPDNQQVTVLPPIEMDLDSAEPVANVVLGSQPWHNSLPSDWVPIIARDVVRQRRQNTQSPMSDAYLQGLPSKRRKLITNDRPSINIAQSLQDTMRHAIQSVTAQPGSVGGTAVTASEIVSQAANDSSLVTAYREHIKQQLRSRLQLDPDYNAALYPNSERKFK